MATQQHRLHLRSLAPLLGVPPHIPPKSVTPCKRCMSINVSDLIQPPQPIDDLLRTRNVPEATVSAASSVFMDISSRHFNYTKTKLKHLLTSLPCLPGCCADRSSRLMSSPIVKAWVRHYEDTLASWREMFESGLAPSPANFKNNEERGTGRPRFNQSSSPFLEAYFELNNYPCPADRQTLAQKTGNTPKQISDWFQNHRNRAKKGGKQVQRTQIEPTFDEIMPILEKQFPKLFFTVDENQIADNVPPKDSPSPTETETELDQHPHSILHVSSYVGASYAFPAKYLSNPDHDPLSTFPDLEVQWNRRPTRQPKYRRSTQHDIDAFIDEFVHKCSIRGAPQKRKRNESTHAGESSWTAATTMFVTPVPAPLPSLVRRNGLSNQNANHITQPSQRQICLLPRRALNKALPDLATARSVPERELESPLEPLYGTRRKVRRLASDPDSFPTSPLPLTPVQDVISLPNIENVYLPPQLFSHFDHPQPLAVLKTISRSFLDYASASIPFGTSFLSGITRAH